jgi:hypothetical protein
MWVWIKFWYANGMFVIIGNNGITVTSPDGSTWEVRTSTVSSSLYSIVYGNGMFVIVGSNGIILTSPNGYTWTQQTINNITGNFYKIIYAKKFVIVGNDGIFISDGFTWLQTSTINALTKIIYGNNLFVAAGVKQSLPVLMVFFGQSDHQSSTIAGMTLLWK